MEKTYYMSKHDNHLYYIRDARIGDKPNSYVVQHIFHDTRTEEITKLIKLQDACNIEGLNMDERIYFVSQFDNMAHNLKDWEHKKLSDTEAYIGRDFHEDGFRVEEEVNLWTLREIVEFYKQTA